MTEATRPCNLYTELILTVYLACESRDERQARYALRRMADMLGHSQAVKTLKRLEKALSPGARYWLQREL